MMDIDYSKFATSSDNSATSTPEISQENSDDGFDQWMKNINFSQLTQNGSSNTLETSSETSQDLDQWLSNMNYGKSSSDQVIVEETMDASVSISAEVIDVNKLISGDVIKSYQIMELLGKGTYGVVYSALDNNNNKVALKIQAKDSQPNKEVEILSRVCHGNIAKIIDFFPLGTHEVIVMEIAEQGDLVDKVLTEQELLPIVFQILDALCYLDNQKIAWLDLKPDNILIHNGSVKLIDFGTALKHDDFAGNSYVGTPAFWAPEIVRRPHIKSDIWSLGITLITLLTGKVPHEKINEDADLSKIIPTSISDKLKSFLLSVLTIKPDERASASELLQHEWLKTQF